MKTKQNPDPDTIRLHTRRVNYTWPGPGGIIHRASTVVVSKYRGGIRAAERRFWKQHTHVSPEVA